MNLLCAQASGLNKSGAVSMMMPACISVINQSTSRTNSSGANLEFLVANVGICEGGLVHTRGDRCRFAMREGAIENTLSDTNSTVLFYGLHLVIHRWT